MDREEAEHVLATQLERYRAQSHAALQRLLSAQDAYEVTGPSGAKYQLEIQAVWDGRRDGNLRVMGSIDDGGIRAFFPLTQDFIIAADGAFVGE